MSHAIKKKTAMWRQRLNVCHAMTKVEIRVMQIQTKECQRFSKETLQTVGRYADK